MVSADKQVAGPIAAIGNFDGVHLGHLHLIGRVRALGDDHQRRLAIVLFDPHPRRYFKPDDPAFLLTTPSRRDALLHEHGIDTIFPLKFDHHMANLTASGFVEDILIKKLGLGGIVVGSEFRFGKDRAGDVDLLMHIGERNGLIVETVEPLGSNLDQDGGALNHEMPGADKIGSSQIRNALKVGDVKAAATMLGRPWDISGVVVDGQKIGRTLGFPTANLTLGEVIAPLHGVYAVRAYVDGKLYPAIANFGRKPTIGDNSPLLEAHLFDFNGDLYGKTMTVEFIEFLREERKFDGLDALKAQISRDCEQARAILAS